MATKLYNLKFKKKDKLIQKGGATENDAVAKLLKDGMIGKCFLCCKGASLDKIGAEIHGDISNNTKLLSTFTEYDNLAYNGGGNVKIKSYIYKPDDTNFNLHNFLLTLLLAFNKLLITPIMTYLNDNRNGDIMKDEIFLKDNLEDNVKLLTGLDEYLKTCGDLAQKIWTDYYQKIFKLLHQCIRLHHVLVHKDNSNVYNLGKPELYTFGELLAEIEPVSDNKYLGGLAQLGVLKIYVKLLWMYTYYISKIEDKYLNDESKKIKSSDIRWSVLDNNFKELKNGNDDPVNNYTANDVDSINTSKEDGIFCKFEQFVRVFDNSGCNATNAQYFIMDKYSGRIYRGVGKDNNLDNLYSCVNLNKADPVNQENRVKDSLFADCIDLRTELSKDNNLYRGIPAKKDIKKEHLIYLMFIIIAFCMDTGLNIYDITAAKLKNSHDKSVFFEKALFNDEQADAIVALINEPST